LTSAIRGVHDATTSRDGRLDAVVSGMTAISIKVDHLTEDVASLKEAEQTFTVKLSRMEERLGQNDQGSALLAGELGRLQAGQTATVAALEEKLRQIEGRLTAVSDFSHLNDRLDSLDRALQVQSETTVELRSACSRLQDGQQAAQDRMNVQADAIRTLHACAGLGSRRDEFQNALERLQGILNDSSKVDPIPDNL
jgi:chromosome segregation ATPase